MKSKLRWKRVLLGVITGLLALAAVVWWADRHVASAGAGRIHAVLENVPKSDVALVLGTIPKVRGQSNPFYEARLDAAASLFRSGKVRGILVSGDNSRKDYDEPTWMKEDLILRGVPSAFITCDFAGFSTLDSIKRAGPVFGQSRVVLVSQRFHLERALFLAKSAGLDASGFVAKDAPVQWQVRVRSREALARVKALVDVVCDRQPKFLGKRENVTLAALEDAPASR